MPEARSPRSVTTVRPRPRTGTRPRSAPVGLVLAGLALVGPALTVAACGQGFDRETAIDSFRRANPDVTEGEAECVIDRQIDRYGLDGLATELEAEPESDEFVDIQFRDMFACGVDGDVEAQLLEQLEASGVAAEDSPCVARALTDGLDDEGIDVLLSGEITEDFMATFVAAMEGCGAGGGG